MFKPLIILISTLMFPLMAVAGEVTEMTEGKMMEFSSLGELKIESQVKDIGYFEGKLWFFSESEQTLGIVDPKKRSIGSKLDLSTLKCSSDKERKVIAAQMNKRGIFLAVDGGELCHVVNNKVKKTFKVENIVIHDLLELEDRFVFSDRHHAKIYMMLKADQSIKKMDLKGIARFNLKYVEALKRVIAVDTDNTILRILDPFEWIEVRQLGRFGIRPGKLMMPKDAAFNGTENIVYVTDSNTAVIQAFDLDNRFKGLIASNGKFLRMDHPRNLVYMDDLKTLVYLNPVTSILHFYKNLEKGDAQISKRLKLSVKREEPICIQCHDGSFVDSLRIFKSVHSIIPKEKVDEVVKNPSKNFPLTKDGRVVCTSCHLQHELNGKNDFLRRNKNDPNLCQECHDQNKDFGHPIKQIESGRMLTQANMKKMDLHDGSISCQTCHDIHQPGVKEVGFTKKELCETCHLKGGTRFTQHRKRDLKGKELDCFKCHQVHNSSRKTSLVSNENEFSLNACVECHKNKKFAKHGSHSHKNSKFSKTSFFKERGFQTNPCLTCHEFHNSNKGMILGMTDQVNSDSVRDLSSRLCLECHKENKQNKKRWYEHDTELTFNKVPRISSKLKIYDLRGNPFDNRRDKKGRIGCLTCHSPHVGKNGKFGKINYKKITPFCVICHKSEGLSRYKYFHTDKYRGKKK